MNTMVSLSAEEHLAWNALEALQLPPGARVGLLVNAGSSLPDAVSQSPWLPRRLAPECPSSEVRFDAVVAVGVLEHTEWDRWTLQQARDLMHPGATLIVVVRNMTSLASAGDAMWLVSRVARELARKAMRPHRGRGAVPSFGGRRYTKGRLKTLLQRSGFDPTAVNSHGHGIAAPVAAMLRSSGNMLARYWVAIARAQAGTVAGGSIALPPCTAHVAAFERMHAGFLAERDRWAVAHGVQPVPARALDPGEFAGAAVLVLAPHPDDEVIGCGGTLLRLVDAGARVTCIQATDGSDSHALRDAPEEVRRTVRLEEAERVAAMAQFHMEAWRADNRAFRDTPELAQRLAARIERDRPRLVFTPFVTDIHPDHLTLNRVFAAAIRAAAAAVAETRVLAYEVWSLAPPGLVCDVTDVRARQEALLRIYATAMKVDDFIDFCEQRNGYHACTQLGRSGYAEVFYDVPAETWPTLVAEPPATVTTAAPSLP